MTQAGLHLADHKPELALESTRRADTLAKGSTQAAALLGVILVRVGRHAEAQALLERLTELGRTRYVPPTSVAAIHAALDNAPAALDALDRAYAVRDVRLVYMKDDGRWSALRQEPRFCGAASPHEAGRLRKREVRELRPGWRRPGLAQACSPRSRATTTASVRLRACSTRRMAAM